MPKRRQRSPDVTALLEAIVRHGRAQCPPIYANELARHGGVSGETLSRMKKNGSGDIAVISKMASRVGLRLALVEAAPDCGT